MHLKGSNYFIIRHIINNWSQLRFFFPPQYMKYMIACTALVWPTCAMAFYTWTLELHHPKCTMHKNDEKESIGRVEGVEVSDRDYWSIYLTYSAPKKSFRSFTSKCQNSRCTGRGGGVAVIFHSSLLIIRIQISRISILN